MAPNSGIFSSMYLRYIDLGIFLSLRSIFKDIKIGQDLQDYLDFIRKAKKNKMDFILYEIIRIYSLSSNLRPDLI